MIICSWDVGIKNLAYCLFSCEDKKINILKWDIINLMDEDIKCDEVKCKCKARYIISVRDQTYYRCKRHNKIDEETCEIETEDTDGVCCYVGRKECTKKATLAIKEESIKGDYCKTHCDSVIKRYTKCVVKKYKKHKCYNENINDIAKKIILKLGEINELFDTVLVENQPTKNPTMKTIAAFIYFYFVYNNKNVHYISASNKLKLGGYKPDSKAKNKYSLTKLYSVEYCQKILKEKVTQKQWRKHLKSYKKKDDLCDALLQGHYFAVKQKLID